MTPEGKVKDAVKKLLKSIGPELDQFWPVQNGMGTPALDCIVCYRGYHCEIETKALGKQPTPRQEQTIVKKHKAGSPVFVIDNVDGMGPLKRWLDVVAVLPLYHQSAYMSTKGHLEPTLADADAMESTFAWWAQQHGYNVSSADRDVWEAAWKVAYAEGRKDADADWTNDVAVVNATPDSKESK